LYKTILPIVILFVLISGSVIVSASNDPIPGVDVIVEKIPPGNSVGRTTTDSNGMISIRGSFAAGYYEVRNRENTIRTGIQHRGGPISWQLLNSGDSKKPWKLVDASRAR
jgi:hypothetical protein